MLGVIGAIGATASAQYPARTGLPTTVGQSQPSTQWQGQGQPQMQAQPQMQLPAQGQQLRGAQQIPSAQMQRPPAGASAVAAPASQPASAQTSATVSGGRVMYFTKPADALVPVSGTGGDPVAQATPTLPPIPTAAGVPDATARPTLPVPAPPATVPAVPARPIPGAQPAPIAVQPKPKAQFPPDTTNPEQYTQLPPREDVFNLRGDAELEQRILKLLRDDEAKRVENGKQVDPFLKYPSTLRFPAIPDVGAGATYAAKTSTYLPMQVTYDSLYVIHRRLHFEDKNTERYAWDLGIVQPFVSAMTFYKDVLLWPNSLASGFAYGFYDTNAGKCMPGSPTPYMLYPPGLTITGSVFEGLLITGAAFAIP